MYAKSKSKGVPHASTTDDVYNGMFIPKGTTIVSNATYVLISPCTPAIPCYLYLPRAINMDESVYKNASTFYPERFLADIGEPLPTNATFGFGRR